ncbi:MAG: hypothetical protein M3Z49_14570, partial [Bifidobacteriales bacterium]|nr:hypothetical protein [Bifidobacteriales bacterium]
DGMKGGDDHISIHAPVKGATLIAAPDMDRFHISIHAPVKGATCLQFVDCRLICNFNPRSREGSDDFQGVPGHVIVIFQSTLP